MTDPHVGSDKSHRLRATHNVRDLGFGLFSKVQAGWNARKLRKALIDDDRVVCTQCKINDVYSEIKKRYTKYGIAACRGRRASYRFNTNNKTNVPLRDVNAEP